MATGNAFLKTFGTVIRARRTKLGLTQEELAGETNFDRTYVSLVERGRRNLSILSVLRFAKALQTTASELLRRTEHGTDTGKRKAR